ncbi:MAG TPA: hypothetical protein VFX02_08175 [Gammaproteobacteria bacterium]|nr:hypothetical protein [Gammaproteobacteria bacterium]
MKKETAGGGCDDLASVLALLKRERDGLKLKIHLARCGIQKEWEKAETKWQFLNGINTPDNILRAEELKQSYIRICHGLLAKNRKLLDQLNHIEQGDGPVTLQNLKRQVASEMATLRLSLETLGGTESIPFQTAGEPVCACLKCQQAAGAQPFNLDEILAAACSP